MAPDEGPLRDPRRPEGRLPGRDQEGLPEARAPVPPGPEPGRQGSRGALQGDPGRLRRPAGPGEAQAVRPARLADLQRAAEGGRQLQVVGEHRRPRRPRSSAIFFGGIFGGASAGGARPGAAPRGERGRDVEVAVNLSFEDSLKGVTTKIPVELETTCSACKGHGAEPGTTPNICPECRGRGVVSEDQGFFALSQTLPAAAAATDGHREAVPQLQRHGPRAPHEALHGEDPGRRQGRHADPPQGQGRGRTYGGPSGATSSSPRVCRLAALRAPGADLVIDVPVTYAEAALGATVEIPTPKAGSR